MNVQPADCETVTWMPATVIVPLREGPETGETAKEMPPPPVPDVDPMRVIHGESLAAVQAHPAAAVIVAVPVPPCAPKECESGSAEKLQPAP